MSTEKPPIAEAAPAQTITLHCAAPGCGRPFEWLPRGGRRPKYGPCHKRSPNVERSELAYHQRKKMAAEIGEEADETRRATQVVRLAAGLRITGNPLEAAQLFGVSARGTELEQLEQRAKKEHERLINGDMRETAHLAESTIHVLLLEINARRAVMQSRDLAHAARFALDARQAFIGDGSQTNYTQINLVFPEYRKPTEEELARVRGAALAAEENAD